MEHLIEIDRQANEQIDLIISQLAKAEGVTEDLKARDQLEWIRRMNSCRARAEEQVIREVVLLRSHLRTAFDEPALFCVSE